jgi:hypothetical protein
MCAVMVFVLTLAPQHMKYETLVPSATWLISAAAAAAAFAALVFLIVRRWGVSQISNATLLPVLATLVFLLGFHGRDLDVNYSARPLAAEMNREAPDVKVVAVESIKRDMDYGLAFYRNSPLVHYDKDGVPSEEHLLVMRSSDSADLEHYLAGRVYRSLFLYDSQGLEVYLVAARP